MREEFVGRTVELDAILRVVGRATRATSVRGPSAIVITGDPGQGKTRLLAEVLARLDAERRRGRVAATEPLRLTGYEPERDVALAAAAPMLDRLATSTSGRDLRALLGPAADDTGPLDAIRIFEAAHRAVAGLAAPVVFVDDVQWVDAQSIALVHYIFRAASASRQPLAIVAAGRPSPVTATFAGWLASAVGDPERFLAVDLGPLAPMDAVALVLELAPGLDEGTATAIARRAGGSPFWIGLLVRSGGDSTDAARLVHDRLRGLGPAATDLLATLTVVARPAEGAEFERFMGWPAAQVESALDELVARGLVVRSGHLVSTAHDLIREAARSSLPDATARRIHARLADILETDAGDDLGALREALVHRREAGASGLDLAMRAISSPRRRMLGPGDLRVLGAVAAEVDPVDERGRALSVELARLAGEVGEHREALDRWTALVDALDSPDSRADAALEGARLAFHLEPLDRVRDRLDRVRSFGRLDPWTEIAARAFEARVATWLEHRPFEAARLAEATLATARELVAAGGGVAVLRPRERRAFVAALRIAYEAATQEERNAAMLDYGSELVEATRSSRDADHCDALHLLGLAIRNDGRYAEAEQVFRRAWDEAQRLLLPVSAVTAGTWAARTIFDLGRVDEAETLTRDVTALAARVGDHTMLRGVSHVLPHEIRLSRGDWRTAVATLLATAPGIDPHHALSIHQWAAVWLARIGGPAERDEVRRLLGEALAEAHQAGCPRCLGELELFVVESRVRVADADGSAEDLAAWDIRHPTPDVRRALHRRWVGAIASVDAGDRADAPTAIDELRAVTREFEQRGFRIDVLWLRLDLARTLTEVDRDRAVAEYADLGSAATELGVQIVRNLADQALRSLGVRSWRRSVAADPGAADPLERLSRREREVARLVAEGATNPEIAADLFLSRKTVETHVSNILAKVGARNRTELATRLRMPFP